MTRTEVRQFNEAIKNAITKANIKGLNFSQFNVSYTDSGEMTFKIKAQTTNTNEVEARNERQMKDLKWHLKMAQVDEAFATIPFTLTGIDGTFTLTKYDSRKRKYPFIVENQRGTSYKLTPSQMRGAKLAA